LAWYFNADTSERTSRFAIHLSMFAKDIYSFL
jgi:hypothetical protein